MHNLIDSIDTDFIEEFSKIRNQYAHSVKNALKGLDEMIKFNGNPSDAYWPKKLCGIAKRTPLFDRIKMGIRQLLAVSVNTVVSDLFNELERFRNERIVCRIEQVEKLSTEEREDADFLAHNIGRLGNRPL
jgi:hypothetical protein